MRFRLFWHYIYGDNEKRIMKHLITGLLFIGITLVGSAQLGDVPMLDDKVAYSEVVELTGTSIEELKSRAEHYMTQADGIELSGSETSKSVGTGKNNFFAGKKHVAAGDKLKIKMVYDLIIEFKDGKYRVIMTNIKYTPHPTPDRPQPLTTKADDLKRQYDANRGKKNKRAAKQYEFFLNSERIFKERMEEIKDVMRKTVPQTTDDW